MSLLSFPLSLHSPRDRATCKRELFVASLTFGNLSLPIGNANLRHVEPGKTKQKFCKIPALPETRPVKPVRAGRSFRSSQTDLANAFSRRLTMVLIIRVHATSRKFADYRKLNKIPVKRK